MLTQNVQIMCSITALTNCAQVWFCLAVLWSSTVNHLPDKEWPSLWWVFFILHLSGSPFIPDCYLPTYSHICSFIQHYHRWVAATLLVGQLVCRVGTMMLHALSYLLSHCAISVKSNSACTYNLIKLAHTCMISHTSYYNGLSKKWRPKGIRKCS